MASRAPAAKTTEDQDAGIPPPRPAPAKNTLLHRMLASRAAIPIIVPTTSSSRVSWFLMWLISWPITPSQLLAVHDLE